MSESTDFNIGLSEMLYVHNIKHMIVFPDKRNKKTDNVLTIWFINVIPRNSFLNPYVTTNKFDCDMKKYKFRPWGFKNEFLKAYDYLMEKKLSFETLPAYKIKCPYCSHEEEKCELFYVQSNYYGNFCWGTLLRHLVSFHHFKPMRFFIEYIYHIYCKFFYKTSFKKAMYIVKIDENILNHFELISRLGYEKKINHDNIDYNVKYFGNIITKCGDDEKKLPDVKSRIKNIGVYFGNMKIENNNLISVESETQYDKKTINYLYYVRPFDIKKRFFNMTIGKYSIEIPEYNEYIAFNSLLKLYPQLLGLLIFANEGIYIISRLDLKKNIENLDTFDTEIYNQFHDIINKGCLSLMEDYKTALQKTILSKEDKNKCYKHFQYLSLWIDPLNKFLEYFNLKVAYFPKIMVKKTNVKYDVEEDKLIYDTIYLPINALYCPTD